MNAQEFQESKDKQSNDEKRAIIKKLAAELNRQEATTVPGAGPVGPKQLLLNAQDVERRNPDKRIRWVNLKNPDKMMAREAEGYSIVPKERGGKRIGDEMVLMERDRKGYEERVAREQKLNKDRLSQHKTELQALAERLAHELQRQGVDIDVNRLLVNEGA